MPMMPQGQPEQQMPDSPQQGQPQAGGASKLLSQINDGINKLGDLVERSQLPPEDKQNFMRLQESFMSFAEGMGQDQSAPRPEQRPMGDVGNVPMEAGARDVRPAL